MVPFNFAPRNYALCDGQIIAINQNTALFALIGIQFGGDGRTTFALPNLNGRVVVGAGQGPGLSNYSVGQSGGTDTVPLQINELPAHQHTMALSYSPEPGTTSSPQNAYLASNGSGQAQYAASGTGFTPGAVTAPGAAHNNQQPYLNMVYCICLAGIFPQRP
nr:tail fiber protein [Hymenobacter lucidus]